MEIIRVLTRSRWNSFYTHTHTAQATHTDTQQSASYLHLVGASAGDSDSTPRIISVLVLAAFFSASSCSVSGTAGLSGLRTLTKDASSGKRREESEEGIGKKEEGRRKKEVESKEEAGLPHSPVRLLQQRVDDAADTERGLDDGGRDGLTCHLLLDHAELQNRGVMRK